MNVLRATAAIVLLLLAVPAALARTSDAQGHPDVAPGVTLALDADPSGNGPRTVASVEKCVSASRGQPVDVDIVIPGPGVPANRGIVAYALNLVYNPAVVWVSADRSTEMLLAQAAGSSVLPIQDPKPDKNGSYMSWAVDFGASGIEPGGTSEFGPGVLSRITLLPQGAGTSDLLLNGVDIRDDQGDPIALDSVQAGSIAVGEACPSQEAAPTPTPKPTATATPTTAPAPSTPTAGPTHHRFPAGGGPPPPDGDPSPRVILSGLALALAGSALLVGGRLVSARPARRLTAPDTDSRRRSSDDRQGYH